MDNSKDLSTWERGAPAPQCLSELLERRSGAGAPRSRERRTSFLQDLVSVPPQPTHRLRREHTVGLYLRKQDAPRNNKRIEHHDKQE